MEKTKKEEHARLAELRYFIIISLQTHPASTDNCFFWNERSKTPPPCIYCQIFLIAIIVKVAIYRIYMPPEEKTSRLTVRRTKTFEYNQGRFRCSIWRLIDLFFHLCNKNYILVYDELFDTNLQTFYKNHSPWFHEVHYPVVLSSVIKNGMCLADGQVRQVINHYAAD
jgi:hypothetical protein